MTAARNPPQEGKKTGSAAIHGGMADVAALDDVNDVFGDVCGVVADALEIFGDENQFEGGKDHAGITHHVGKQLPENLVAEMIDFVVAGEDFLREIDVAADDCIECFADHLFGDFAHARQIHVRLDTRMAQDAEGALGDVDGLIADAFEVVVDAGHGEDESQIGGHKLMEREQLHDAVVDFNLKLVDGVFFFEDALGEGFIGIEHGVNGLVDGTLCEASHPEQALFELVQILFKMAFHVLSSLPFLRFAAGR